MPDSRGMPGVLQPPLPDNQWPVISGLHGLRLLHCEGILRQGVAKKWAQGHKGICTKPLRNGREQKREILAEPQRRVRCWITGTAVLKTADGPTEAIQGNMGHWLGVQVIGVFWIVTVSLLQYSLCRGGEGSLTAQIPLESSHHGKFVRYNSVVSLFKGVV